MTYSEVQKKNVARLPQEVRNEIAFVVLDWGEFLDKQEEWSSEDNMNAATALYEVYLDHAKHHLVEEITYYWARRHGDCVDCGAPAAFYSHRYKPESEPAKLCAVCTANDAVDGMKIERIEPHDD